MTAYYALDIDISMKSVTVDTSLWKIAGGTGVTIVDGENVRWESIVDGINTGLTGYEYVLNDDESTKDKIPLVLDYSSL